MNQTQTLRQQKEPEFDPLDDFERVPGLFRRWEFEQVLSGDHDYHIEAAGELSDKTQVFAVYRRDHASSRGDTQDGVPVGLTFDNQHVTVRARLLPITDGEPLMAILVLGDHRDDTAALSRVREHLARAEAPATAVPTGTAARRAPAPAQEGATP